MCVCVLVLSRVWLFATPWIVVLQARILEWVAIPFCRGSSQPRNQTWVSHIAGKLFTVGAPRETLYYILIVPNFILIRKKKRPSWSENKGDIVGLRIPRVPTAKTGVKLAESSSPGSPAWSQEQKSWDPEWLPGSQNPLRCPPIPGHVWLPCPLPATDHGVCSPIHFNSLKLFLTSTATTLSSPWATLNLS